MEADVICLVSPRIPQHNLPGLWLSLEEREISLSVDLCQKEGKLSYSERVMHFEAKGRKGHVFPVMWCVTSEPHSLGPCGT